MNWEQNVRKVVPYTAGEQPKIANIIKLNTNENPYPPAPGVGRVLQMLSEGEELNKLRLYPDMDAKILVAALADFYNVKPEQVFAGVGSDDVLALSFLTFFNSEKPVLFPDITYSFYDVWANLYRIPFETVPLKEDFTINPDDYLRENGGVIIANPNAPTGAFLPLSEIEKIVAGNPDSVVIVDEAYVDFGAESALPLIEKYENLLVVQTFSKSRSLAGMRIGFAIGNEKLIGYLKDVKFSFNSYTLTPAAILCGAESVKDGAYFAENCRKIAETREAFAKELRARGFVFAESKANFIFAKHPEIPGEELFAELRKRAIVVRHFKKPRIGEYLRISIGTPEQMAAVVTALDEILGARA